MIDRYEDLTIEKYLMLKDIDKEGDDIDMIVEAISILSDFTEDEVLNLPLSQFNKLSSKLKFISEEPKLIKKLPDNININGKMYSIVKDASKMTAGQYIDYKSYAKDFDSINKNLALIMTTVIVPQGKKYGEGYDTVELSEEFKRHLNIVLALSISNFFFIQFQNYSNNILIYLEVMLRKMRRKEKDKEMRMKMTEAITQNRLLRDSLKNGFGLTMQSELEKYMDAYLNTFSNLELLSSLT